MSRIPILLGTPAVLTLTCETKSCDGPAAVLLDAGDTFACRIVCAACAQDEGVRADALTRQATDGRLCFDTDGPLYQHAEGVYSLLILGGFSDTEHAPHVRELGKVDDPLGGETCIYCGDVDR